MLTSRSGCSMASRHFSWMPERGCLIMKLRGKDLNLRPLGYAYRYSFRCLAKWPVCGLDFLFTLRPALPPLGCLPLSLYTFSDSVSTTKAWLGITLPPASPSLTGFRAGVSFCAAPCRIAFDF
jgi:hypothetical protein